MKARKTSPFRTGRHRSRLLWKTVTLFLAALLAGLPILLDNKEDIEDLLSSKVTCDMQQKDAPASFNALPLLQSFSLYRLAFHFAGNKPEPGKVKVLYFGADLPQIEGNVCQGRLLTADLLDTLAQQRPSVVALDKSYSPSSCENFPETTRALQASVSRFPAPVVIGQSSAPANTADRYSCQCLAPNLPFPGRNVQLGYMRLNEDILQIPLRWVIREEDRPGAREVPPMHTFGLAFATALQLKPELAVSLRRDFEGSIVKHPFADLWDGNDPESESVRDYLCTNGNRQVQGRWHLACSDLGPRLDVTGKAIVIGAQDVSDLKPLMGENQFGYEVHARYVAALLGGAFLRGWELWARLLCALPFSFVVIYIMIIYDVDAKLPSFRNQKSWFLPGRGLPARQRTGFPVMSVITCLFAVVLIVYLAPFAWRYLPPLDLIASAVLLYLSTVQVFATERWINLNNEAAAEAPIPSTGSHA